MFDGGGEGVHAGQRAAGHVAEYLGTRGTHRRQVTHPLVVHLGVADGNLHILLGAQPFTAETKHRIEELVYSGLPPHGGSISAEHGIGLEKRDWLHITRSAEEVALMRTIKAALDPKNLLNPGKVLA